ncbi:hypothetical protein [Actinomadura madurae]|uniref:hypothetical protein n=1 Tax=Actinomadura madurae TaxID=1993 RepID=UPI0020D1FDCD|nr:hypothetical protein [Actinomadura madurae]MCQ0014104.1 hypothetical protein [Actinomadura madurae]
MPVGNVGDVSFTRLISADLRQTITAVPQSLDNQWFDRDLLGEALRAGRVGRDVLEKQARRSRREYLRALLNAEKVLINRAFLYNNRQVYQDYAKKGPDQKAFREMLASGVIIPMLLSEDGPLPADGPRFQVTEGIEAWRRTAESTPMSCLRLSWDDTENALLAEEMNRTFGEFLTGFLHFKVRRCSAISAWTRKRPGAPSDVSRRSRDGPSMSWTPGGPWCGRRSTRDSSSETAGTSHSGNTTPGSRTCPS